jgi:hypothetical protein
MQELGTQPWSPRVPARRGVGVGLYQQCCGLTVGRRKRGTEAQRCVYPTPNHGLQPTASSVRYAPASGSGSCLAFGFNRAVDRQLIQIEGGTNVRSGDRKRDDE